MIEKICNYIELAKKEIFEVIENELEEDDISMEGAEFMHYCLENIKHLEMMKEELMQEYVQGKAADGGYAPHGDALKKDMGGGSHKSAFGGV